MKKITTILAVLFFGMFVAVGSAMAVSFDFSGNYAISDTNDSGFADTLTFDSALSAGSGVITLFDPYPDGFISVGDYVVLADLTFDESNFSTGEYYYFSPDLYSDGFQVWDKETNAMLFKADLTVDKLSVVGKTGLINPFFTMNLTNITAGGDYKIGDSTIVDAFLKAPGGSTQITLQFGNSPLPDAGPSSGSYSGKAAPVPEPSTMLFLGTSLLGLLVVSRRKIFKK